VTSNGNQDEEDLVSQVTATNLSLSGTSDIFQFTTTILRRNLILARMVRSVSTVATVRAMTANGSV